MRSAKQIGSAGDRVKEKGNYKQELAIFIAENGLVLIGFGGNVLLEKKNIKKTQSSCTNGY